MAGNGLVQGEGDHLILRTARQVVRIDVKDARAAAIGGSAEVVRCGRTHRLVLRHGRDFVAGLRKAAKQLREERLDGLAAEAVVSLDQIGAVHEEVLRVPLEVPRERRKPRVRILVAHVKPNIVHDGPHFPLYGGNRLEANRVNLLGRHRRRRVEAQARGVVFAAVGERRARNRLACSAVVLVGDKVPQLFERRLHKVANGCLGFASNVQACRVIHRRWQLLEGLKEDGLARRLVRVHRDGGLDVVQNILRRRPLLRNADTHELDDLVHLARECAIPRKAGAQLCLGLQAHPSDELGEVNVRPLEEVQGHQVRLELQTPQVRLVLVDKERQVEAVVFGECASVELCRAREHVATVLLTPHKALQTAVVELVVVGVRAVHEGLELGRVIHAPTPVGFEQRKQERVCVAHFSKDAEVVDVKRNKHLTSPCTLR
eukprot:Opistho-1_new@91331